MVLTISAVGAALSILFRVMNVAPKLRARLAKYKGKPTDDDRKILVQFARVINERRVFHASFHMEVVEACLGSLGYVKDETEKVIASISHPAAEAVLGAFLDDLRAFLDKWHGKSTPRTLHLDGRPRSQDDPWRDREADLPAFFSDLGQLRERANVWFGALKQVEPKVAVPKFDKGA
jgi:hypothetical protein